MVSITDDDVLLEFETKADENRCKEQEKEQKRLEREQKKKDREQRKELNEKEAQKKENREQRRVRKEKEAQKKKGPGRKRRTGQRARNTTAATNLSGRFNKLTISSSTGCDAECTNCGLVYGEDEAIVWICCGCCNTWFDLECAGISESEIPSEFLCENCPKTI